MSSFKLHLKAGISYYIELFVVIYSFTFFRQEQGTSLHNRSHEANHQVSAPSFDRGIKSFYSSTETVSVKMSST